MTSGVSTTSFGSLLMFEIAEWIVVTFVVTKALAKPRAIASPVPLTSSQVTNTAATDETTKNVATTCFHVNLLPFNSGACSLPGGRAGPVGFSCDMSNPFFRVASAKLHRPFGGSHSVQSGVSP